MKCVSVLLLVAEADFEGCNEYVNIWSANAQEN